MGVPPSTPASAGAGPAGAAGGSPARPAPTTGFLAELARIPLIWRLVCWIVPFALAAPVAFQGRLLTAFWLWLVLAFIVGGLPFTFAISGPVRRRLGLLPRLILGVLPIVLTGLAWWLLTRGAAEERVIPPAIMASPGEVLESFSSLWFEMRAIYHAGYSLLRVVAGWAVACAIALPLGMLMAGLEPVRAAFQPLASVGGYLPLYALLPLAMMWFGPLGTEMQKVLFLALAGFFYLLPLVVRSLDAVPQALLQTGETLGASRWQVVWRVLVPGAFADIFDAMRLSFAVGWSYIIVAEMMSAEQGTGGLGYLLMSSLRRDLKGQLYLILGIILVMAYVTDRLLGTLGRALFPYKESK